MCPYWSEQFQICIIGDSKPTDYRVRTGCRGCEEPWQKCPNYEWAKDLHNGVVPPPSYYKRNWGW